MLECHTIYILSKGIIIVEMNGIIIHIIPVLVLL